MELHRTRAVAQRQQEVCHLLFQPIVIARGLTESYAKNNIGCYLCNPRNIWVNVLNNRPSKI